MVTTSFVNLKVISLNVNGLCNITKLKALFLFCRHSNADLILLQEVHWSVNDSKFWRSQWGDQIYLSHATNHSAGVAILFNKFKGNVVETHLSAEGRWIILVLRINGGILVVNNIYGHNNNALAKNMIIQLTAELKRVREKYTNAHLIIGGDLNDTAEDLKHKLPARMSTTRFNVVSYLCERLNVVDAWQYMHPYLREYTWSNATGSLQS